VGAILLAVSLVPAAHADRITGAKAREMCAKSEVGPLTPYGETAEESAAKKVAFEWNCMVEVDRKLKEAGEKYVSKDWCDHAHLITKGKRKCGTWADTMVLFGRMGTAPVKDTDVIEFPVMSSVNGDHVTMYGAGVDIFRVVNGKLTDHWDASPPLAVSLTAHDPRFPAWVMGGMKGPPPGNNP
jgi:predicted SnoaL-like aldol condensation-catalyzing enzyme